TIGFGTARSCGTSLGHRHRSPRDAPGRPRVTGSTLSGGHIPVIGHGRGSSAGSKTFLASPIGEYMQGLTEEKFDRVVHAEATGRWWDRPCWDEPNCDVFFPIPVDAVHRSAEVLRKY